MLAKVRRWGNGLALRVHKRDLESAGVAEGNVVQVELIRSPERGRLDLASLPTFEDDDKRASERHDRYLYGGAGADRGHQLSLRPLLEIRCVPRQGPQGRRLGRFPPRPGRDLLGNGSPHSLPRGIRRGKVGGRLDAGPEAIASRAVFSISPGRRLGDLPGRARTAQLPRRGGPRLVPGTACDAIGV